MLSQLHISKKPNMINEAFAVSEKISKGFPFVRVDLYIVNGKIYFGEMTFTPCGGMDNEDLPEKDRVLGALIDIE